MANWQGFGRTNYFRVSDKKGLRASLKKFGYFDVGGVPEPVILLIDGKDDYKGQCKVMSNPDYQYGDMAEGGFRFARCFESDEDEEGTAFEPNVHVMPYVAEGSVVVFMDIGREGAGEIAGYAEAYVRRRDAIDGPVTVDLEGIYERAAQAFKVTQDSISLVIY